MKRSPFEKQQMFKRVVSLVLVGILILSTVASALIVLFA